MKLGWMTLLTMVPWKDVIANAPKVAEGAKKLWRSVSGPQATKVHRARSMVQPASAEALTPVAMEARITELEAVVGELQDQMLTSAGLVQQLAEQNKALVQRIDRNRVRTIWLAVISVVSLVTATIVWFNQP